MSSSNGAPAPVAADDVYDAVDGAELIDPMKARAIVGSILGVTLRGRHLARRSARLGLEAVKITAGRSDVEAAKNDWRFKDEAWRSNPVYHRWMQLYLAWAESVMGAVADARMGDREADRTRFCLEALTTAAAPTNTLAGNPAALKRAFDTSGASLVRGVRNAVDDARTNNRMPRQVAKDAYTIGSDLAATPGSVVYRDEICEVLQFAPAGGISFARPMLMVAPQINKYYFMDLAPGRSFVEYAVSRGLSFFAISWRNPGKDQAGWSLDDYAAAEERAIDIVRDISKSDDVNLLSLCAGGILTAGLLSHLAAESDTRVNSASFGVTLLDFDTPAPVGMFRVAPLLSFARDKSKTDGILEGRSLGAMFNWMRPNDLVWNYYVNNYLLGEDPPRFDILAWNADATNLPGRLHGQFLDIFQHNQMVQKGALEILGSPVDLSKVTIDTYVTGATKDHLTPWRGCFRTTSLLPGDSTFVLSNAGHIASLINPPGNPKAHYFAGPEPNGDAEAWQEEALRQQGTWWEHWAEWASARSGEERKAPAKLGNRRHPPIEPAPGQTCGGSVKRVLWEPTAESVAAANVTDYLRWLDRERGVALGSYPALWEWSTAEQSDFWRSIWDYYEVEAAAEPDAVLERATMPGARWFPGARLNYAEHVLARAPENGPALLAVAEGQDPVPIATAELRAQVGSLAAALREYGVGPGDRVAAYVGNLPEAVVAMLAVTSIGAVWTVCAPDFGTKGVLDRFVQVEPSVLIAVDGYRFGGREHDRLDTIRVLRSSMPGLKKTILIRSLRPDAEPPAELDAVPLDLLLDRAVEPEFQAMDFEDPLWILYSSGTTGTPKGIVQGQGGILLEHLKSLGLAMDLRAGDRYFFYSSTSWMAWNYLVGGLLHGTTIVLYDGSPSYPDLGGNWGVAAATGATTFGTGSAYVSACSNSGLTLDALDLSALRTVIPTGSPLPPAGWEWLDEQLPGVRIDPIAGGTDVCTAFTGGSPLLPVRVDEIPCRWPGIAVDVVDSEGRSVRDEVGEFVVTKPMPSMPIELWNDADGSRYRDTYFAEFPGIWRQGDWASISPDGAITILGRSDSTLNRGGVRIGSAEIYASVESHPEVADSLVVGVELPNGEYLMPLFVVAAEGAELDDELCDRIRAALRAELSPRHVPDVIVAAPAVPRTITGKKLEVPIKRILQGAALEEAVAVGVVDRPDVLDWYVEVRESQRLVGERA